MQNQQRYHNLEDFDPVPLYLADLYHDSPPPYEEASIQANNNGAPAFPMPSTTGHAQPFAASQVQARTGGGAYARVRKAFEKAKMWMKTKLHI
ncbi:hypothetical protein B0H12DRAFT_1241636 [Mycena haematopus]|nr:hypothetical protein B0H12DRAFT_1241636 [Mycena haematopus]